MTEHRAYKYGSQASRDAYNEREAIASAEVPVDELPEHALRIRRIAAEAAAEEERLLREGPTKPQASLLAMIKWNLER